METPGSGYTSRSRLRIQAVNAGKLGSVTEVPGQPPVVSNNTYAVKVVGQQLTVSRENLWQETRKLLRSKTAHANSVNAINALDIGGNFHSIDNYLAMSHREYATKSKFGSTTRAYRGPLFANGTGTVLQNTTTWPTIATPSESTLNSYGASAVQSTYPGNPSADLAVALAEIVREGMPSFHDLQELLDQMKKHKASKIGSDEYLNFEFGIRPILAEIRKFANAVVKSDQIMRQYDRDAGRLVRRRFSFPTQEEVTQFPVESGVQVYPTLPTSMYETLGYSGLRYKTRTRRVDVWFSGAYFYSLPYATIGGQTAFARDVTRARVLLGLKLDIEVLWNLAPWSWFLDWFGNIGQVIANCAAFQHDGLVMKYGYLMYREVIEDKYVHSGVHFKDGGSGEIQTTFGTVLKKRTKAHPYGFGVRDVDLTPRQVAILAAIGISGASH